MRKLRQLSSTRQPVSVLLALIKTSRMIIKTGQHGQTAWQQKLAQVFKQTHNDIEVNVYHDPYNECYCNSSFSKVLCYF